jgi:outer membrane protein OmpA-like peptidoglycan-associated protein
MDGKMVNRPSMLCLACVLATLALPSLALAQANPALDAQGMRPSPSPHAIYGVDAADTSAALDPAVGLWLNYASAPLVGQRPGSEKITPVVDQQLTLHLTGALGIVRNAELGFDMPLLMVNNGSFNDVSFGGVVIGDLSTRLKGTAFSSRDHAVGLAGVVEVRLPTGDDAVFASNGGALGAPTLVLDTRIGPALIAANAGLSLRSAREVRNLIYGSEITYGLAARVDLLNALLAIDGSLQGRTQLRTPFEDDATSPLEALVGVRIKTPAGFSIGMAGGGGIVSGVTAPEFRALVSVSWAAALVSEQDAVALKADASELEDGAEVIKVEPEDRPSDKPVDKTADKPADKPVEASTDKPAQKPPARADIARVDGDKIVFKAGKIAFKFGTNTLRDTASPLLDDVAALLIAEPALRVEIGAHTDTLGDPDENLALSAKQAEAVRAYLIGKGVAADRLVAKGYGGEQPIIPEEASAEDEETNRRIVFTILR